MLIPQLPRNLEQYRNEIRSSIDSEYLLKHLSQSQLLAIKHSLDSINVPYRNPSLMERYFYSFTSTPIITLFLYTALYGIFSYYLGTISYLVALFFWISILIAPLTRLRSNMVYVNKNKFKKFVDQTYVI